MPDCICHVEVKAIQRSAGRSVTASVAYRDGIRIRDERTGEVFDYSHRGGVEHSEDVLPPSAAGKYSTCELWNAAEQSEKRINSTVGREYIVAIPCELTQEERRKLAVGFASHIAETYGVAANVAIHEPGKNGDGRNYHAHIMTSTRELTPDGFGAKTRILDGQKTGPEEVKKIRQKWADISNGFLRSAGSERRMDARSFADRGIGREPEIHLGPAAAAIERRHDRWEAAKAAGIEAGPEPPASVRGDANREIRELNALTAERDGILARLGQTSEASGKAAEPPIGGRGGTEGPEETDGWDGLKLEIAQLEAFHDALSLWGEKLSGSRAEGEPRDRLKGYESEAAAGYEAQKGRIAAWLSGNPELAAGEIQSLSFGERLLLGQRIPALPLEEISARASGATGPRQLTPPDENRGPSEQIHPQGAVRNTPADSGTQTGPPTEGIRARKLRDGLTLEQLEAFREGLLERAAEHARHIAKPDMDRLEQAAKEKAEALGEAQKAASEARREAENSPPERGLFGIGYEKRKAAWELERKAASKREEQAQKALGEHRQQTEAGRSGIMEQAREEARRKMPTDVALMLKEAETRIGRMKAEARREKQIAELDWRLERGGYSPGSAGFRMLADSAKEVMELERKKGRTEDEIAELHPKAAEFLREAEAYKRQRGKGHSR